MPFRLCHRMRLLGLLAALLGFAAPTQANDFSDFLGRRITRVAVVIEGVASNVTSNLDNYLDVAAGQEFSAVRIRDSLARLYRSGFISNARVEATAVERNGVVLTFVVKVQPRVESVGFDGISDQQAQELRSRLTGLDTGEKLTAAVINRGLADIHAYYSSRGYYQAKVTSDVRLDPTASRATVTYTIAEGEQARLERKAFTIIGASVDLTKVTTFLEEGKPFSEIDIQRELEAYKKAYLEQDYLAVRISSAVAPDLTKNAARLTINIESGPKIEVVVNGLPDAEKKKRELLPFYTRGNLDEFSLEDGRRRLLEYVQLRGYFFAEITKPSLPDTTEQAARLEYLIEPGVRYRLTDIDIKGLEALSDFTISEQFLSEKASFIPFFGLGHGKTSNELLRHDANLIERALRDLGYRRAKVDVLRGVSVSGESLLITFRVKQGARTHVDEIALRGNTVLTADELLNEVQLEADAPLVASDVRDSADRILSAYEARGYANAEVVPELVDLGNYSGKEHARLIYVVNEGNRVRIQNVSVRGDTLTSQSRLLKGFALFKPGDWLRAEKIQETERALYETDAFSSVNITSRPVNVTADGTEEHDVSLNLVEAKPYILTYGFGYQKSNENLKVPGLRFLKGARGLVQLTNANLFGKLYSGSAQVRVSENELFGQISFQDPRPFGKQLPVLISLFGRRLGDRTFNTDRYTALIQVEKRLSPASILYFIYNFERVSIFNPQIAPDVIEEELPRNQRSIRLGRIGPSYVRDTRDRASEPTRGALTLGSFSVATKALGGNSQFAKFLAEHNRYYSIKRFRDTVYSVSGRLGLAAPYGGSSTIPISERFFGGGARDLRGFDFELAGPRDNDGNPLGGNALLVINNELRFPIYRNLGGAVFSDTGNVFRRVRDFRVQELTQTVGFGLRLQTPVGPVRVDIGSLIWNKPDDLKSYQIHFSFGSVF